MVYSSKSYRVTDRVTRGKSEKVKPSSIDTMMQAKPTTKMAKKK
jgi:hypothetical protein